LQTLGALPTVSIQKTDGCQVYLSKDAIGAEIVTSKSSEMNILVPKTGADEGDFVRIILPIINI
jgi:adenylyl cyclase-associated protein